MNSREATARMMRHPSGDLSRSLQPTSLGPGWPQSLRILVVALFVAAASSGWLASCGLADESASNTTNANKANTSEATKIVLLAGRPSHGYGSHEHLAGCRILAEAIEASTENVTCQVIPGGWPEDESVLDDADAIVMYADGGGGHPVLKHLKTMNKLMDQGVGLVCLHYAVEVPKEAAGKEFLNWLGGYFETHWSVNPHWVADFQQFPEHPITRGVKPFAANDEWYFHMRFRPEMEGVTPILSAVPPEETMLRGDGPHSGNPAVREAVGKRQPQHVAWAFERPASESAKAGRSFGFTGGHYHWNWGREDILKLVANAIVWTAGREIPADGLQVFQPSFDKLKQGQDEQPKQDFDPEATRKAFKLTAATGSTDGSKPAAAKQSAAKTQSSPSKPLWASDVVTSATPGHSVKADVDIRGAKRLYLVVTDGGNGFACDWANWANPVLVDASGKETKLTDLKWTEARADWGQVQRGRNVEGGSLIIGNSPYADGIGTHANSLVAFDLPAEFTRFKAVCGLDQGGTSQAGGGQASVRFRVYADKAPEQISELDGGTATPGQAQRDPAQAVAGLTVHEGLEAKLVASEPELLSLTNLDIDHRGRIWVCEVVNYRGHNGKRPEGDRILILEDTNQDGVADSTKVFYQGRDIDSAMGICVLGNQVIVSASPNVWIFTDENGDDVPDRKELLFSKTGQPQHDHSAHSFLFGPDGKLYWNFGNTGKAVHDAEGNPVVDMAGNTVVDNGRPYYGGMPFRCDMDGSNFEVLAHNFRNNYEVTVDSFGALWQSDNDDDGNRATRINFVMEYGNYGYLDELTGAGWRSPRTNMEATIPEQHWHLNDPGVVPTMLITGAGSPTGITVYEGDLLPEAFHGQVIHCDAGPNVVRAYPVKPEGAGYSAEILNVMEGELDKWFRPADVCVAPDGSLFVTDWYDPGVGGHQMGDLERGRLFRVAPPGSKYVVPDFDFSTPAGAVSALKNPNLSVRFMAWKAIEKFGAAAESDLANLASDEDPRMRARALWAMGKLLGEQAGRTAVGTALSDEDENVQMMGIRLARQLKLQDFHVKVVKDRSPAVRRELAIALRHDTSARKPVLWATLAMQHDNQDRWYLEALGIGAGDQWDACLAAYLAACEQEKRGISTDIIWRARSSEALPHIVSILSNEKLSADDTARFLRTLEFHPEQPRNAAIATIVDKLLERDGDDNLIIDLVSRLPDARQRSKEAKIARLVNAGLADKPRDRQLEMLRKLSIESEIDVLLGLAIEGNVDTVAVGACELLLDRGGFAAMDKLLRGDDVQRGARAAQVLAACAPNKALPHLKQLLSDDTLAAEVRVAAASGLTNNDQGAKYLLGLASDGKLLADARFIVGAKLRTSNNKEIRQQARELFPAPTMKSQEPLPELAELVKLRGDAEAGAIVFQTVGTCAKCHVLSGQGKNVGPDLSEIGSKLAREALYGSIIDPSAGISHNYESWAALTESGQVVVGLMVSQTEDRVVLKDAEGIERELPRDEIEELKKLDVSLMPANLIESISTRELVDLVEYLTTLKKG